MRIAYGTNIVTVLLDLRLGVTVHTLKTIKIIENECMVFVYQIVNISTVKGLSRLQIINGELMLST